MSHQRVRSVFFAEHHVLAVLLHQPPQVHDVTDTFVEIIGTVVNASTIKLMACINMGSKLGTSHLSLCASSCSLWTYIMYPDMTMVNQVIEMSFDPKFRGRLF
jgi:replication factor A3